MPERCAWLSSCCCVIILFYCVYLCMCERDILMFQHMCMSKETLKPTSIHVQMPTHREMNTHLTFKV